MGEPGKDGSYKFAKEMPEVGRAPIYGLTNVHEMISEAWSNTGFRELLSKMGFMEKVKDAVYKFFGNENKTALDQVTGLSEKIGEFADKNWDEISRSMAEYAKTASIADLKLPGQTVAEAVAKKFTGNPKVNAITKGIPGMKGMSVENIAKTLDPESIVDMFKKEKDLPDSFWTKVVKNFTISGEQMANLFRSPGLYAFTRYFDRAHTLSDFYEKTVVTPLKENLKQLIPDANWKSLEKVKSVMMAEDLANEGRRPDLVAKLNPAEQKAYKLLRDAFDKQVDHVNEQRLAMGLDPITPRGAYMASHWDGPWRAEVHTKIKGSDGQYKMNDDGTHALSYVGPITGHSIAEVRKGLEYVQKTNKDAVITQQPKYKQQVGDYRKNVVQTYKDMVKLLGENSPGMQDMRRALEGEAEKMGMNVEDFAKHFETKHGARFFGGDRPWMDPRKDTMSWYRNQLDTLHDGYKWSAMQKAITDAKGVLSDPHMIKNMPEMHNVLTEYSRIQMGFGKADSVSKFENAFYKTMGEFFDTVPGLREVPIDMRTGMMLMRNAKNLIYLKALGFWKPAHFFVNGIFQPFFTMPRHMKLSAEGYSHNPWTTLTRSMRDAQAILLNHYAEQMGGTGPKMDDFAQKMSDFIKSNGIATNNPFSDVGELGRTKLDAFIKRSQAIGGYFMQEGERLARVNAFVSFAHHLDQSGKFTDMNELFQEAKRNTTETMGSFKHTDRAAAFVKAGITGTGLSTLRQFEINFMNQFHDLIKYGMETKNYGPLALFSGIQLAFAGVMGFIGFETIDQIWRWFRDMIPTSMVSKEFAQWSPKAAAMKDLPQLLSRGLVSPMTGINFASSLEAGTIVDPSLSGMLPFISEIKNTIVPAWDYVTNPTSDNLHKMVWNETPYGSRGTLETGKFAGMDLPDSLNTKSWYNSPSGVSQSPNNPGEGSYRRTPEDTNIRSWGFLSTQEGQSKEAEFMSKEDDKMFMNRQQDVMKALDSSIRNHDVAMGGNSIQKYIEMQGDPQKAFSNEHFMKMAMDWNTSYEDRTAMGTSSGLEGIYKYQRLHEMLNQIKRYYGPANAAR
jgi:hypothetical protein